jgi:hypothetical protein
MGVKRPREKKIIPSSQLAIVLSHTLIAIHSDWPMFGI